MIIEVKGFNVKRLRNMLKELKNENETIYIKVHYDNVEFQLVNVDNFTFSKIEKNVTQLKLSKVFCKALLNQLRWRLK